ncbi:proteophosphoglycan ppg4 [Rhodotorula toruloides]|uniref:Proteophosphoglycan ppg4 n=1 Tax=Rhodotorula toruloides TaxID=5286 RepID=A0A511KPU6_RHOTO|nr:proteophosphoglycan ppg4 [Rhodotorula toruloides]
MQQPDSPFQTGSASASPFAGAQHVSMGQADRTAFGTTSAHSPFPLSGTNTPAPLSAGSTGSGLAAQQGRGTPGVGLSPVDPFAHLVGGNSFTGGTNAGGMQANGAFDGMGSARPDKGKGVAREPSLGEEEDNEERQKKVERVLKRAEASRLARNFRNRLALASFKTQRGWQDVKLDIIEPHMQQESLRRKQQMQNTPIDPTLQHQIAQGVGSYGQPQAYAPAYSPPPIQHAPHAHRHVPEYQQHMAGGMEAVLGATNAGAGPSSHPTKRPRLDGVAGGGRRSGDLYSGDAVYAPQPQPTYSFSPYATDNVYQPKPAPMPSHSSASTPRGQLAQEGRASSSRRRGVRGEAKSASPAVSASPRTRTRTSSRRGSPAKQPLSSNDPSFSSFVDAATALTGMARAPSDPSASSGSDEGGSQHQPNGAVDPFSGQPQHPPPRPSTPERQVVKLPGAPGLGVNGSGDGAAEGAAELMLYLAASPSPVQSRKTVPNTTMGDGMKGRRLFSGGDGGASAAFGGDLNSLSTASSSGALEDPFSTPAEPSKSAGAASLGLGAPATPGRQRQPSLNGGWESFINASPSPKRSRRSAAAANKYISHGAEEDSPPHGAIGGGGEAQAAW